MSILNVVDRLPIMKYIVFVMQNTETLVKWVMVLIQKNIIAIFGYLEGVLFSDMYQIMI